MGKKIACIKCGSLNELFMGTCICKDCNQSYGVCKRCHRRFDASGGVSAVCDDCLSKQADADSDGTFIGRLDAKIMNSNHSLEKDLLKILIAIPILKPIKLRRKDGAAWWFGTIWLTLYLGLIFTLILFNCLDMNSFACAGVMGWSASFLLLMLPKALSTIRYEDSKIPLIIFSCLMIADIVAMVVAYNMGTSMNIR